MRRPADFKRCPAASLFTNAPTPEPEQASGRPPKLPVSRLPFAVQAPALPRRRAVAGRKGARSQEPTLREVSPAQEVSGAAGEARKALDFIRARKRRAPLEDTLAALEELQKHTRNLAAPLADQDDSLQESARGVRLPRLTVSEPASRVPSCASVRGDSPHCSVGVRLGRRWDRARRSPSVLLGGSSVRLPALVL